MNSELGEGLKLHAEQAKWVGAKLEQLGDTAMNAQRLEEAISEYSSALSLEPAAPTGLLIKRSEAYMVMSSWEDALNDVNKVCSVALRRSDSVEAGSLGDHARSIISMGLPMEARSFTRGRALRRCHKRV